MNRMIRLSYFRIFFCFAVLLPCVTHGQHSDRQYPIERAKQILFLGNSITYDGRYIAMVESLLLTHNGTLQADLINLGLPSETVSGLSEQGHAGGSFPRPCLFDRLGSVLEKTYSDITFVCYGMNDGIYLPFDKQRFKAYKQGMNKLYKQLLSRGTKRIIVLTPPIHDDRKLGLNGYNKVLDRYSEWLLQQRKTQKWEVIDLHFPMKRYLENVRQSDSSYRLAKDGIHPDTEGHWLMAQEIMTYLFPDFLKYHSWEAYLNNEAELKELFHYVSQMQDVKKKSWLSYTGHKRPGIPTGLSMSDANSKVEQLKKQIFELLEKK